jgi:hypothetical protein
MVSARELPESLSGVDLGVIDALKALKEEADILRERLTGLEAVKADFDPSVFSRVHADYTKQLSGIEAKAEPMRQQARDSYARLRGALNEISNAHEAVKLDRQEIELRRKLGERAVAHKQGEALRSRFLEVFASEEELLAGRVTPPAPGPGPASTQEMPAADEIDIPFDSESIDIPAASIDIPAAQTQILQVLKLPEPPKVPSASAPAPPASKPASFGVNATMSLRTARLVPQNPEAGRTAIPLPPKPVSLGADPSNEIRIGGPGVEPKHARLTVDSQGYSLSDLGSKSGTRVNAEAIQQRLLRHEDVIQIGMARFVFREG